MALKKESKNKGRAETIKAPWISPKQNPICFLEGISLH
jgi:hypothetical protein